MKQEYSFENCYKILNSNTECSWNTLRKTYKLLIQKWHPDRYKDGSVEKNTAEEKIKELNKAYQQLSKYYRKNGALPRIERDKPRSKTTNQNSAQTRPQSPSFTPPPQKREPEKADKKNKAPTRTAVFVSIAAITISYFSLDFSTESNSTKSELKNSQLNHNHKKIAPHHPLEYNKAEARKSGIDTNISKKKDKIKKATHKQFTYGSSIVDVIMAQGTPSKAEGDTWYYGESKVYFHNGIVQSWERKLGSPLNAGISLKKATPEKHGSVNTLIH